MEKLYNLSLLQQDIDIIKRNKMKIDFRRLNPFYRNYLELFWEKNEAAQEYILTSLLTSIGAAISTNRFIQHGNRSIYPNFWIIISGKSTRMRKSTGLSIGLKLTQEYQNTHPNEYLFLPVSSSSAALFEIFDNHKHGIFKHDEIATFLTMMRKGYNIELKSVFTQLFDVPDIYPLEFKNSGIIQIHRPFFCIATATTPGWLKAHINNDDLTSGFLARFLYCHQEEKKSLVAFPAKPTKRAMKPFLKTYKNIFKLTEQEVKMNSDFKSFYSDFYDETDKLINTVDSKIGLDAMLSRLQVDYFFKFCILEAVLGKKETVTKFEAERARYLTVYYIAQAMEMINRLAKSNVTEKEDKVLEIIRRNPDINKSFLYKAFNNHISSRELNGIISSLEKCELIRISEKKGKETMYRIN